MHEQDFDLGTVLATAGVVASMCFLFAVTLMG
jgi:hypothetical protein